MLPLFLGSVSFFLVLLALGMRSLAFPHAARSSDHAANWQELFKKPTIWLFAAVFFLYPGAETAVGGGSLPTYRGLAREKRQWRR